MSDIQPLRMTQSRRAILATLTESRQHLTADEVYLMVRGRLPKISLATVYRNLDLLAREGLIRKVAEAGEQRRYDGTVEEHQHIRCSVCGRVDDVELRSAEDVWRALVDGRGYEVQGYTLCFVGVCSECAGNGGGSRR